MGLLNEQRLGVMFDMDGLLLDTERLFLRSFVKTREHFGMSGNPEIFISCIGLRPDIAAPIIRASLDAGTDFETFNDQWNRYIAVEFSGEIPCRPGAKTLLRILSEKKIAIGVATSTATDLARQHLQSSGLLDFIGPIVGGDMVARPKPDPQAYMMLADALGRVATDCVAFEDSDVGTRAAVASGATTVQVPDMLTVSDAVRNLGHVIAPSLLDGALAVGLIGADDMISVGV